MIESKEILALQEIYNKLHKTKIELPKVVVIGSQSSGKSSVLELLLKKEFLPRGTNIVTRCPIILHLKKSKKEYVKFTHLENNVTDFKLVQEIILKRMDEICGNNKNISNDPIILEVFLKNTLEISIVDLPGLTKVPIGDQPYNIETQIENMVIENSKGNSTLILAIVNANIDIANCESLKIARKVDPKMERTIGVVTKIDLMDASTNCIEILNNMHSSLKLGYIGVLSRSQLDIKNKMNIEQSVKKENNFFKKSIYKVFMPKIGSKYLLTRMHELFYEIVKKEIPKLKEKITQELLKKKSELYNLGDINTTNIYNVIMNYFFTLQNIIGNKKVNGVFVFSETPILYEFRKTFSELRCEYDLSSLRKEVEFSNALFVSEEIFKNVVRHNNVIMLKEMYKHVETILNLLKKKVNSVKSNIFSKFVIFLNATVCKILEKRNRELILCIENYMEIQSSYVNIRYPEFNTADVINKAGLEYKNWNIFGKPKSKEDIEFEILTNLSKSYLDITKRNFVDYAMKLVYFYLLRYLESSILEILLNIKVNKEYEDESKELNSHKDNIQSQINDLQDSIDILSNLDKEV